MSRRTVHLNKFLTQGKVRLEDPGGVEGGGGGGGGGGEAPYVYG